MSINAKIIKHSTSYLHVPLVTWILEYPRYIHSELMTHRVFSKNSASSRAIPLAKFIKMIEDDPVMPKWTLNQSGMQGPVITDKGNIMSANRIWTDARFDMIKYANALHREGIHKQNINRLLEPWMHIRIILTGTEFSNWFKLRNHKDAHPEIQELARNMYEALEKSKPTFLQPGEWHIPFDENIYALDDSTWCGNNILMASVSRCARISYNSVDGAKSSMAKDLTLFDKLVTSEPLHASPAEHQAKVPNTDELRHFNVNWHLSTTCGEEQPEWAENRGKYHSNLSGWIQLRKLIECGEFK